MSDERSFTIVGNDISDGYHTFTQLYAHRIELFIALCRVLTEEKIQTIWRSLYHADGSCDEGWFILGIYLEPGHQITYHLPESRWGDTDFAETLRRAPEWDGHTPDDVLRRLAEL